MKLNEIYYQAGYYSLGSKEILYFLIPFIILYALESTIIYLFYKKHANIKKIMLTVLLINLLTWPLINTIFLFFKTIFALIILELIVIMVEAVFIKKILGSNYKKAILTSFIANTASLIIGNILLMYLFM